MDEHAVAGKTDEHPPGRVMTHFNQRNLDTTQRLARTQPGMENHFDILILSLIIRGKSGTRHWTLSGRNVKHGLVCSVISS